MINRGILLCSTSICGALLAAAPMPALAQTEGDAADRSGDQEIVVTATRREERVLDVPYNISAVSGRSIEDNQVRDQAELLRSLPGIAVVDRGARNAGVVNSVTIRGMNVNSAIVGDYALIAANPVSTYVNETPLFASYLLKDLDRVEVLRGPQGTLYGSGSLGGTVRFILRKPELGKTEGRLTAGISTTRGSSGIGYDGDAILNLPIGDRFAIRAVGSRQHYAGLTDYPNVYVLDGAGVPVAPNGVLDPASQVERVKDADYVHVWYGRIAARWQPSDAVDLTLTYNHQEDDVGGRRQVTRGDNGYGQPYGAYENGSVQREPSSRTVDSVALEATIDMGFATLTSSSSYYDHRGESVSENTGYYAQNGWLSFYYNYPRPMASAVRGYGDRAFVEELRIVSNSGGPIDYVVGTFFENQRLLSTQESYLRGFKRWWDAAYPAWASAVASDNDFLYRRVEHFHDRALFGELTWHVTDRLQLTGGGRYFWNVSDNEVFLDVPVYSGSSQPTNATYKVRDQKALFKFNASYDFADTGLVYATASQGYRRGGSSAVPTIGRYAEDPAWQRFNPDTAINYEVGIKGRLGPLAYTADLFYIDWRDIQINTVTPNWGFFVAQNGGKARSRGFEIQLDGRSGRFHYALGYTYVDAKLTQDAYSPTAAHTVVALKDAPLPGVPNHVVTGSADYSFALSDDTSLVVRGNGYYQSGTRNAISVSPKLNLPIDGFSLWNASATLTHGKYSLTLFAKNIFNADGVTGVFSESYMGTAPSVGYYGNGSKALISLPRTIGLTVDVRF